MTVAVVLKLILAIEMVIEMTNVTVKVMVRLQ